MALKTLLVTLFIVIEIIVFFGIVIWINWVMEKYEVEFTELWLILFVLINIILFIWIMLSFIFYISF